MYDEGEQRQRKHLGQVTPSFVGGLLVSTQTVFMKILFAVLQYPYFSNLFLQEQFSGGQCCQLFSICV